MSADNSLIYNSNFSVHCSPPFLFARADCCDLQADVNNVSVWASAWNTLFNSAKSASLTVTRAKTKALHADSGPTLNGGLVSEVNSVRLLGLCLTSSSSWSKNVHFGLRKVGWTFSGVFVFGALCPYFPFSINVSFVLAWCMPVLCAMAAPQLIFMLSNAFSFLLLAL